MVAPLDSRHLVRLQTLQAQSKVGKLYVVDADCSQAGIPYGENFYVHNRYCLMRVSPSRARLIVHSEIKYKKNVWGLVKSEYSGPAGESMWVE